MAHKYHDCYLSRFVISNISNARTSLETWYLDLILMHNILGLDALVGLGFHVLSLLGT
jgi:hypothetical protein